MPAPRRAAAGRVRADLGGNGGWYSEDVDPRSQTTEGEVPLKTALEVIGGAPDWATALEKLDPAAPEIQVMRDVMRFTRRFSQTSVETVGVVSVQMMEGEYVPGAGRQFVTSVVMEADTGDEYELALSRWETDYLGMDTDGWQPILRPGGKYRVVGVVGEVTFNTRSVVEVESIELISPPKGTSQMIPPIQYFLPSTAEQMQTWLR